MQKATRGRLKGEYNNQEEKKYIFHQMVRGVRKYVRNSSAETLAFREMLTSDSNVMLIH